MIDRPRRGNRFRYDALPVRRHVRAAHLPLLAGRLAFRGADSGARQARSPSTQAVDAAARLVFLLAGVSYYKTAAPPLIDLGEVARHRLGTRVPPRLLPRRARRVRLPQPARPHRPATSTARIPAPPPTPGPPSRSHTGQPRQPGRSCLSAAGSTRSSPSSWSEPPIPTPPCSSSTGRATGSTRSKRPPRSTQLPVVRAERTLDPALHPRTAGNRGFFNGHVPVTGILSAVAVLTAVLTGRNSVVMSNEWSASSATVDTANGVVNHQYSKSLAFEAGYREVLAATSVIDVDFFSALRPYSELWVAERFARLPQYHRHFRSCNRAFHIDRAKRLDHWCGHCDKCCFIDLILAPFLPWRRSGGHLRWGRTACRPHIDRPVPRPGGADRNQQTVRVCRRRRRIPDGAATRRGPWRPGSHGDAATAGGGVDRPAPAGPTRPRRGRVDAAPRTALHPRRLCATRSPGLTCPVSGWESGGWAWRAAAPSASSRRSDVEPAVLVDDDPTAGGHDVGKVTATADGGLARTRDLRRRHQSPGISRYRDDVTRLERCGVAVVGGLGLWLQEADLTRVACVTGTKGKSTTTSIAGHLLRGLGATGDHRRQHRPPALRPDDHHDTRLLADRNLQLPGDGPGRLAARRCGDLPTPRPPRLAPRHGELLPRQTVRVLAAGRPDRPSPTATATCCGNEKICSARTSRGSGSPSTPRRSWPDALGLLGDHNRRNALIAAAVLQALGVAGSARRGSAPHGRRRLQRAPPPAAGRRRR